MEWIKKQLKQSNSLEIGNLNYLMTLNLGIIPRVRSITKTFYLIEKCNNISGDDFAPSNFDKLYHNLLIHLYKLRRESFSPGIYKYFFVETQNSLKCEVKNQKYIPYIMSELEKIIQIVTIHVPKILEDSKFDNLLKLLRKNNKCLENWHPAEGYSLIHGDLHTRNIVKRGQDYLFIDFEFLRYGAKELEIANLTTTCLLQYWQDANNKELLLRLINDYNIIIEKLPSIDIIAFRFFFAYTLCLFYLSLYLKKDQNGLKAIKIITEGL